MIYIEYHKQQKKLYAAQAAYDEVLSEKEELFNRTQPQAVSYEKERVSGGENVSPFDTYLIAKEQKQIDERLKEAKHILIDRQELLTLKLNELKASKEWHDIVYKLYYIDRLSIRQIERRIPYSERQIYRFISIIKNNLRAG